VANDRIYLKCKECGQLMLLFKYWGTDGLALYSVTEKRMTEIEQWATEHLHDRVGSVSLDGDPGFTLETE
jgi:hypothetical protein